MFGFGSAIRSAMRYNRRGIAASVSILPRIAHNREEVFRIIRRYRHLLDVIARNSMDADVTVKLQQLGILKNPGLTAEALDVLAQYAAGRKAFVWVDMERASTIDTTLDIFDRLHARHRNTGICLQAYHRRTIHDAERVLSYQAPVRLVKGFYNDGDIADWAEVTRNYRTLMVRVIGMSSRPGIATHDIALIKEAISLIDGVSSDTELQFFAGVRDRLAARLVCRGIRVRAYIPFGNLFRYIKDGWPTFDVSRQAQRFLRRRCIV